MLVGVLLLTGCGSKSKAAKADGYWLDRKLANGHGVVWLYIDGNKAEYWTNLHNTASYDPFKHYEGTVEKTEDGVDLYFPEFSDYCPLHVKVTEDGTLYLSSDNSGWSTDSFNRSDKKTYEDDIADGRAYPRDDDVNAATAEPAPEG